MAVSLALILAARAQDRPFWQAAAAKNAMFTWLPLAGAGLLAAILATPIARDVFRLAAPRGWQIVLIVAALAVGLLSMEAAKLLWAAFGTRSPRTV
jgi:hypothetical protein